ncbi:PLP-dependent aminotransferase family protein [Catenulispora pinisilvae]|uniref:MocR-like pyridoxine biosynthesis transcription factor PdxR n=1 Tax=Catenulispora pinisilvae TaxID=2705253 RepID=UPI001890EA8E|nr:PLP-dependent aminotransferase family protein [Catenulispora pinisilvae]
MAEILVTVDRAAGRLVEQLVVGLRDGIRAGRIAGGTVLPPSRQLAAELRLSRGIVVEAYQQLVAEGYVLSRTGAGTWVASGHAVGEGRALTRPDPAEAEPEFDLTPGRPDLGAFPRTAWVAAQRRVLSDLPHAELGYGDPGGVARFREEIAGYLRRVRAADATPDRVVAINGSAHGLALGLQALYELGHRVLAVEDPSADRPRRLLVASGMTLVGVPVDEAGLVVSELRRTDATVVFAGPAHQYPTGVVLAPARRAELIAWARAVDGTILEDDYDAEFRYDREPVGCLQGMAPDRVLYLGTTSKSLAPALRLGWAVAPPHLATRLREIRLHSDLGGSVIDHLAMAHLIGTGAYDRHLRTVRRRYRARRDALVTALSAELPQWKVRGVAAGLHALVDLPEGSDEDALTAAAEAHGVRIQPLAPLRFAPGPPGLVLGYAGLAPGRLAEAARRLGTAARGL